MTFPWLARVFSPLFSALTLLVGDSSDIGAQSEVTFENQSGHTNTAKSDS